MACANGTTGASGVAPRAPLVAVPSYSYRLFVKAFLSEGYDGWREGVAAAFTHLEGVLRTILGDNACALVFGRDHAIGIVVSSARLSRVLS